MDPRRSLLLILATAWLPGCSSDAGQPTDWRSLDLKGKRLDLQDDRKLESYAFHGEGLVAATLGIKDGPLTAPLFYWRIEGGRLVISESPELGSRAFEAFREPAVQDGTVTVKRSSGESARFKLSMQ